MLVIKYLVNIVGFDFTNGNIGMIELIVNAGSVAKGVLLVLLFFSIVCWGIIFIKIAAIRRINRQAQLFHDIFIRYKKPSAIFPEIKKMKHCPDAEIFMRGFFESNKILQEKRENEESVEQENWFDQERLKRILKNSMEAEVRKFENYLIFLATTGNTAPFIGLFGTVWGIMDAFRGIGVRGTASLAVVAPGISEALVATAAGLAAAIPAVIAYNYFTNRAKILSQRLSGLSEQVYYMMEREISENAKEFPRRSTIEGSF
ncbi:MAG: MotA/TolQ/ExbB proton channel family protein [Thermodesulfobacteriota bacterium]|nr:MotA/TolQ/ExbB proton channel family protein [Thermodesulfobacteriota bacterium]